MSRPRPDKRLCRAAVLSLLLVGCPGGETPEQRPTVVCRRGRFERVVRERGVVNALRERTVKSPTSRQIIQMVPEGTVVKEGDVLFRLDPTGLEQRVKDRAADQDIAKASHARRKASSEAATHYAEQNVASARMALELATKELDNARAGLLTDESEKIMATSDVKKSEIDVEDETRKLEVSKRLARAGVEERSELDTRIVEKGIAEAGRRKARAVHEDVMDGLSRDELREYELEVELAKYRLASAEKDLKETKERNTKYLKHAHRRVEWAERSLKRAEEEFAKTVVHSPAKGLVLIKSTYGGQFAPGMWAYKNREIMGLPDLSAMKVDTFVEESVAAAIKKGQKVRIRTVALPDTVFEGSVIKVGSLPKDVSHDLDAASRLLITRPERRAFEVAIRLKGKDERLKPGMNAEIEIVTAELPDAVVVPRSALLRDGETQYVNVLTGAGVERRDVQLGLEGEDTVAVIDGLEDGDEVVLRGG